jgi:hypothetical protein
MCKIAKSKLEGMWTPGPQAMLSFRWSITIENYDFNNNYMKENTNVSNLI